MEEKLGEAPSSVEEYEVEVVQHVDVDLRHPLAMLQRRGGASMVGEEGKLLHGLE